MSAEETRLILEAELGLRLANIFEWIDLDRPLGSASISQVLCSRALARLLAAPALQQRLKAKPKWWMPQLLALRRVVIPWVCPCRVPTLHAQPPGV